MDKARQVILENFDLVTVNEAIEANDVVIFKKGTMDAGMVGVVVGIKDGKAEVKLGAGGTLRVDVPLSDLAKKKPE